MDMYRTDLQLGRRYPRDLPSRHVGKMNKPLLLSSSLSSEHHKGIFIFEKREVFFK